MSHHELGPQSLLGVEISVLMTIEAVVAVVLHHHRQQCHQLVPYWVALLLLQRHRVGSEFDHSILGGSWVVISRVISRVTILISHIRGLITPLLTTHEPPSSHSDQSENP